MCVCVCACLSICVSFSMCVFVSIFVCVCVFSGMSTAHEVIVARHCGLRVFALSLITNKSVLDYDSEKKANHEEVLETARLRAAQLEKLIANMVSRIETGNNNRQWESPLQPSLAPTHSLLLLYNVYIPETKCFRYTRNTRALLLLSFPRSFQFIYYGGAFLTCIYSDQTYNLFKTQVKQVRNHTKKSLKWRKSGAFSKKYILKNLLLNSL